MKKAFSTAWIASKQPRKQRKYRAQAPLHIKRKMISSHLNETLRKRYKTRSIPIRKGDVIKIMNGNHKGKTGKIEQLHVKKLKVRVEGIFNTKKDGSKVSLYLDPSNILVQELELSDQKRIALLKRKTEKQDKTEKKDTSKQGEKTHVPKKK
jgi:large subunit ribosomal protein L24